MPLFRSIEDEFQCEVRMSVNHAREMVADGEWTTDDVARYFRKDAELLAASYDRTPDEFVNACNALFPSIR